MFKYDSLDIQQKDIDLNEKHSDEGYLIEINSVQSMQEFQEEKLTWHPVVKSKNEKGIELQTKQIKIGNSDEKEKRNKKKKENKLLEEESQNLLQEKNNKKKSGDQVKQQSQQNQKQTISSLGTLPPLKIVERKPQLNQENETIKQQQIASQIELEKNNKQIQKMETYTAKMQIINEADDPQFEESQNLGSFMQNIKRNNKGFQQLGQISDKLEILEENNNSNNNDEEEDDIQNKENKNKSIKEKKVNSDEFSQIIKKQRFSEETQRKLDNYIHQIDFYNKIQEDSDIKNSIIRQFDFQREAFWHFQGDDLKQIEKTDKLKILVITWNLQGGLPPNNLEKLLKADQHHVIVIGTQECERSIPASIFISNKDKWEKMIMDSVGEGYLMIKSSIMNAMHLTVLVHQGLKDEISQVESDSEATGIANIIGNKGGVSISMKIGEKQYLFINSHFASGQENSKKRNKDAEMVKKKLMDAKNKKINQTIDFIFWLGDLNYRIQQEKTEVKKMIDDKKFLELLMIDQLLIEKQKGNTLVEFKEGLIMFPPTYKLKKNDNLYPDGEDNRIPGWTDRILYYSKEQKELKQVNYDCAINMFGSDHRPVFSQFLCQNVLKKKIEKGLVEVKSTSVCQIF